jgi:hypothetical protein
MFIVDDARHFAECVVRLLSDGDTRVSMRGAGPAYLDAHHSLRGPHPTGATASNWSHWQRRQFFRRLI